MVSPSRIPIKDAACIRGNIPSLLLGLLRGLGEVGELLLARRKRY